MVTTQAPPVDPKRLAKAEAIVVARGVSQVDDHTWHVASQSGSGHHIVSRVGLNGAAEMTCTCADWQGRNDPAAGIPVAPCKHVLAVEMASEGEETGKAIPDEEAGETEEEIEEVVSQIQADAVLWQVSELEAAIKEVENLAQAEVSVIECWRIAETEKLQRRIGLLVAALEPYMRSRDRKTLRLPHGELKLRALQDKIEVDDEAFDFSREDLVRVIPEKRVPDMGKIRSNLKATGEVPDGVDVIPQEPKFSYKTLRTEIQSQRKEVEPGGASPHAHAAD